jgi:apolipoprotein N-acyltransferase
VITRQRRAVFARGWIPWVSVLVSVFAMVVSFPPFSVGWLSPCAVATFAIAVGSGSVKAAAVRAGIHGALVFAILMHWVTAVAPVALVAIVVVMALWSLILGILTHRAWQSRWPITGIACAWVVIETLRSWVPWGGVPWGRLAFVGGLGVFTRVVFFVSAAGLSWLIAAVGAFLARAFATEQWQPLRIAVGLAGGIAAVLGATFFATPSHARTVDIGVVQGGVPREGFETAEQEQQVYLNHLNASRRLLRESGKSPAVLVWPESSVGFSVMNNPPLLQQLKDLARSSGVPIVTGTVLADSRDPRYLLNRGMVWGSQGQVTDSYDKQHLVPFGEFVPLRSLARKITSKVDLIGRDFRPGTRPGLFTVANPDPGGGTVTLGDLICFEVAYDALVRPLAKVDVLINQTNNASYLNTWQPLQQFRMAQVRAAEIGRSTVVAATSGVSGVINEYGQPVAATIVTRNVTKAALVSVPVGDRLSISPYVGPALQWCAFIWLILCCSGFPWRRSRR